MDNRKLRLHELFIYFTWGAIALFAFSQPAASAKELAAPLVITWLLVGIFFVVAGRKGMMSAWVGIKIILMIAIPVLLYGLILGFALAFGSAESFW